MPLHPNGRCVVPLGTPLDFEAGTKPMPAACCMPPCPAWQYGEWADQRAKMAQPEDPKSQRYRPRFAACFGEIAAWMPRRKSGIQDFFAAPFLKLSFLVSV